MPLSLPNRFVNGEIADAVPVDDNDQRIQSYLNTSVITADGLVAMAAPLSLVAGVPSSDNHAASKSYVDSQMPIGTILMWAAPTAPAGHWHLCDGGSMSRTNYVALFAVCDYRYGGSGGTFLLPNLKARFPIGLDPANTNFDAVGEGGGTFTVPVPPHGHGMNHDHGSVNSGNNTTDHVHAVNPPIGTTSLSGAHQHNGDIAAHGTVGGNSSVLKLPGAGTNAANVVDASTTHSHTLDLGSFNSGVNTTDHIHPVDLPNYVGATADNTAAQTPTGIATTQIPPYLTVNFIIRII